MRKWVWECELVLIIGFKPFLVRNDSKWDLFSPCKSLTSASGACPSWTPSCRAGGSEWGEGAVTNRFLGSRTSQLQTPPGRCFARLPHSHQEDQLRIEGWLQPVPFVISEFYQGIQNSMGRVWIPLIVNQQGQFKGSFFLNMRIGTSRTVRFGRSNGVNVFKFSLQL